MPGTIGIDKRGKHGNLLTENDNMCCDVLAVMVRVGGGLEIVMFDILGY